MICKHILDTILSKPKLIVHSEIVSSIVIY